MTTDKVSIQTFSTKSEPKVIMKLALLQIIGTLVFSLILFFCFDKREALSALCGGAIAALASLFFAGRLFTTKTVATDQDSAAGEILIRFYFSVALKALLTLALMAICILVLKVSMLPFMVAYIVAAVIVNWLFLLYSAR
ncbi:MAG: ATP synthase subunit I [Acidiferrobacterales bacterium]|nr:ATP synthase subunit I [Acidiferrobacterales bacterium]